MRKSGEFITITAVCIFTVGILATIFVKTRHDGLSLYPPRAYPYQGQLNIGTNQVHEPKW